MKSRMAFIALLIGLCLPLATQGQKFVESASHAPWSCRGWTRIENADLYCDDAMSHQISKVALNGGPAFSSLPSPPGGDAARMIAIAEDPSHTVYAVDGVRINIYSPDGKYQKSLTPGIDISQGIAVLDPQHIFVTGRMPRNSGNSTATVFLVGPSGIERSFSDVFVHGFSGMDDRVINTSMFLALDRSRKLLYETSQNDYEIRKFDLDGNALSTISPPPAYRLRVATLRHVGNGVMRAPGDAVADITVLPDGGLALRGVILDSLTTSGNNTKTGYSRFVDIYDPDGNFLHRFSGGELQLQGAYFSAFDEATGKAYFSSAGALIEAQLKY